MKFKGIVRNSYTDRWDEALPIGNGTIGGLIFGNPTKESIITNHEELFLPTPANAENRPFNGKPYLEETRRLLHEGKFKEATSYYLDGLAKDGATRGEIIWTDPYETASVIHIDLQNVKEDEISDYVEKLDFATGEALVSFSVKGENVTRRAFASRSRNILAIEMRKDGNPFSAEVSVSTLPDIQHIDSVKTYAEDDCIISEVCHSVEESGYFSVTRIITDGVAQADKDGAFLVSKANYLFVYYTLSPWKNRMEAGRVLAVRELTDLTPDYEALLKEHEIIHRELFERVKVVFSDSEDELTNNQIRALCKPEYLAPEFLERMTDFGRYLQIASFGKIPPNLQGVWNGAVTPPWSSDYTLDENVQMMLWSALPGGFNGFVRCYLDWLETFVEDWKINAESYYGCRGIFSAPRVSSSGILRHFHDFWPMCFWTAGAGWLSQVYEDYYEFNGDENILMRGVNFWKEVVAFYEDFMVLDDKGHYEFAPSYSPENTPLGNDSPTAINATMDIAVCREVYTNLINACKILDIEEENVRKWEAEFALLPEYAINEDGAVKEWTPEYLKDDYHHRHSSHLYMVFPGHEALKDGNEELLEACHKAAKFRLIDGVDAISGWGLAHLANISARIKDDELWYLALNRLIQVFTLDNFFTGHNPHSLFQMDANLGITAAVYEMFAYSDTEKVELFPIWCDYIPSMKIAGLRARGGIEIESLERDRDSLEAVIENHGRKVMRIVCPEGFSFEDGDTEYELEPSHKVSLKAFRR